MFENIWRCLRMFENVWRSGYLLIFLLDCEFWRVFSKNRLSGSVWKIWECLRMFAFRWIFWTVFLVLRIPSLNTNIFFFVELKFARTTENRLFEKLFIYTSWYFCFIFREREREREKRKKMFLKETRFSISSGIKKEETIT